MTDIVYTIFRIWRQKDGRAKVDFETNDDDDDGYPDGQVTRDTFDCSSLEQALEMAGRTSHRGLYGQPVDVYLDGEKI